MLAAFCIVMSLVGFYLAIRPFKFVSKLTPKYYQISYTPIKLQTEDGVNLAAWFVPSQAPSKAAIILLHGYPADKGDILPSRIFLQKHFNLLFLDFRYFGESEGSFSTIGNTEVHDVNAAVIYLKNKGYKEIGVWGFSLGGAVALMAAAKNPNIKAVVAEASFATLNKLSTSYYRIPLFNYILGYLTRLWGILFLQMDAKEVSPLAVIANIKVPTLIIHSKVDPVISIDHAYALQKAAAKNKNVHFILPEQGLHGETTTDQDKIIRDFFTKALRSS